MYDKVEPELKNTIGMKAIVNTLKTKTSGNVNIHSELLKLASESVTLQI